jgi:hypothetical protein
MDRLSLYGVRRRVSQFLESGADYGKTFIPGKFYQERLFQNFSFWNSLLRFRGKTGLLTGFSKSLAKTNRVLEQAQDPHLFGSPWLIADIYVNQAVWALYTGVQGLLTKGRVCIMVIYVPGAGF